MNAAIPTPTMDDHPNSATSWNGRKNKYTHTVLRDESHQYMTTTVRRDENVLSDMSRVDAGRNDAVSMRVA
jgi:hypothetical protein